MIMIFWAKLKQDDPVKDIIVFNLTNTITAMAERDKKF